MPVTIKMSLLEITEQKKAELRADWENRIKKTISDATGTHATIDTHLFPAGRYREMNAERSIIINILEKLGLKFEFIQKRKMGWTEWQHWYTFTVQII